MKKKLITVTEAKNLDIETIQEYYSTYISKSQVNFFKNFAFGNDVIEKSIGSFLFTKDKKILDLTGGIGVLNHGHNHPRIINQRTKFQFEKRMEVHKLFFSQYLAALSHNVAQVLPGDLNKSFFPNSGAEAIDGAIKLAYKYHQGKRKYILHSDISFHGKTIGAANISGSKEINFNYQKMIDTDQYEFNNYSSIENKIEDLKKKNASCYAIIVEPLSASTLRKSDESFLKNTRNLCNKENIILIYDEIYSGWCKTGQLFNFIPSKTIPDILVYAKSFGGGKASISGYTVRDSVMNKTYDNADDFALQSTTFNGFGEESVTAIEALNIIFDNDYEKKSIEIGSKLRQILENLKIKYPNIIDEVRGSGCFQGFTFKNILNNKIEKVITNLIPIKRYRDDNFFKKILCASIINHLYKNHQILTFGSYSTEVLFKISPIIETNYNEIQNFEEKIDKTLSVGVINLVTDFVKYKFLKK
jgi:putrescine aminotransferase